MADKPFVVRGRLGKTAVEIRWEDGSFGDATGRTAAMIAAGRQVAATATGPFFAAAAAPVHVALLTAVEALDEVASLVGADAPLAKLRRLSRVPAGATA